MINVKQILYDRISSVSSELPRRYDRFFFASFLTVCLQIHLGFSQTSFTIFLSLYLSSNSEAQGQVLCGKIMNTLKFLLLYLMLVLSRAEYLKCPIHQQHFEKIIGCRPSTHYDINMNFNLKKNMSVIAESQQLNTFCWSQCYKDINCFGYIYFLKNNTCFGYSVRMTFEDTYYIKYHKLLLLPDANAVFFQKMCLKVPGHCQPKMWPIIRYPGALVVPQEYERSEKLMSRRECVESCIQENKFACHSVIFIPSSRNNFIRSGNPSLYVNKDIGQCVLNTIKSPLINGTLAGNSSSSHFRMEYIENLCVDQWSPSDSDDPTSECSFEKYYNRSFIYADSAFDEATLEECQMMCFQEDSFSCRGISYISRTRKCLLHSDDIALFGELSLRHTHGSVYMRRVECLNVTVACMDDEMIVRYRPRSSFKGKLYLNSRFGNCSIQENRNSSVNLKVPFGEEIQENICGIVRAYEMRDDVNRTLISTLIVIQKNPSMRTYDDRVIKIGCVINNSEVLVRNSKEKKGKSIESQAERKDEVKLFSNSELKFVKIELFDLEKGIKVSEVNLGQRVLIKIYSDSLGDRFKFRVVNLTAISESGEEMLLIDEKGCPEDPSIITTLRTLKSNGQFILTSQFRAFKFFDSPRVIFKVLLQFCTQNCSQMICGEMSRKEIGVKYYSENNATEVFDDLSSSPTHMDLKFPEIFHSYRDNSLNNATVDVDDDNFIESSEVHYQRILASLDSDEDDDLSTSSKIFEKYNSFYSLAMHDFLVYTEDAKSESFVFGSDSLKDNSTQDPNVNTFKLDDLVCIDTTLLKILFSFFVILIIVILLVSYCCIRRHRKLAEYESNSYGSSSLNGRLPKFLQGHRHVKWADENFGFVY
ncbi:uncharacterized protein LOC129810107 [Phlebotomus papatasi]|uniref:uncharacterized protein LOC129810107 n=1 Tax=Phlebotomus papatasi TaxID=29031 RepID=UPI0024837375|nr:uncharacterized protein LOC129810107 [Phlebotomus papatasi]